MIEYPSISNTKRVKFGDRVIVFDKIDGSNFRAKWNKKNGFCLFGTRTQLIDETTPYWSSVYELFMNTIADKLEIFCIKSKKDNIIIFSEFYGDNSFAGHHEDEPHRLIPFDLYDMKNKSFLGPEQFIEEIGALVEIPRVLDKTTLDFELITNVRNGYYDVKEGVICKGLTRKGNFSGGVPMYKIKTMAYLDKLRDRFKDDWEKYSE